MRTADANGPIVDNVHCYAMSSHVLDAAADDGGAVGPVDIHFPQSEDPNRGIIVGGDLSKLIIYMPFQYRKTNERGISISYTNATPLRPEGQLLTALVYKGPQETAPEPTKIITLSKHSDYTPEEGRQLERYKDIYMQSFAKWSPDPRLFAPFYIGEVLPQQEANQKIVDSNWILNHALGQNSKLTRYNYLLARKDTGEHRTEGQFLNACARYIAAVVSFIGVAADNANTLTTHAQLAAPDMLERLRSMNDALRALRVAREDAPAAFDNLDASLKAYRAACKTIYADLIVAASLA